MAVVTGDRYLVSLLKFVENHAEPLIDGILVLKLNPVGLRYVHSRLEALVELESLLAGAPVDYLRAYVSDLGDHRALEQLRRILRLLHSLKVVSVLPPPARDPTPLSLLPFGRLRVLELRGCDLSTSAAINLLELRHTLEKLICHNSTDALRHVFASRIAEIKDSPMWNRLSFVSCACNGLVLMDESLQLLPVVETLDLSRNKFSKVDNLWKCPRLKHLDLGFNHLRTVASFSKVSCQLVKLVLRNNALTSLRGIENLTSLEGLDLSYNIISHLSEVEVLAGLPSMKSLWLEGNPICCSRWYRAQVFSYFPYPEQLKLDDKKISTTEFWKRQIIVASRQKQPASFGFYSPAKYDAELSGAFNTKRKKLSRLVSIESEEQSTCIYSDQDSVSCDNDTQSREENSLSEEEAEIVELMNRIECMKKERSNLWLHEFKEWMNQESDDFVDGGKFKGAILSSHSEDNMKTQTGYKHIGETSRYISDSMQASGDDSSTNVLESDNSFAGTSINSSTQRYFTQSEGALKFFAHHTAADSSMMTESTSQNHQNLKSSHEEFLYPTHTRYTHCDSSMIPGGARTSANKTNASVVDGVMESYSPLIFPRSPPHYQEDILLRRHNLEEEFLQLSVESFSVASSDSNTSCSEVDSSDFAPYIPQVDQCMINKFPQGNANGCSHVPHLEDSFQDKMSPTKPNGTCASGSCADGSSANMDFRLEELEQSDWLEKKRKRKLQKRVILLSENNIDDESGQSEKLNVGVCRDDADFGGPQACWDGDSQESVHGKNTQKSSVIMLHDNGGPGTLSGGNLFCRGLDNFTGDGFSCNVTESGVNESCTQHVRCICLLHESSGFSEREVVVILSSQKKLYVLLIVTTDDGSGTSLQLIGCHRIEGVKEIVVGLGLQVIRVSFDGDATYLFLTRNMEEARQLLSLFDSFDTHATKNGCPLRSLEQLQIDIFERQICGGSKMNIYQYSLVLFWCDNFEDDSWLSRSLFVLEGHLAVCTEDRTQFGSLSESASSSYFLLDSCCSIFNVSEMVIETTKEWCITLSLEGDKSEFYPSENSNKIHGAAFSKGNPASDLSIWKLKWFSQENLFKFVTLMKAIHGEARTCALLVHQN